MVAVIVTTAFLLTGILAVGDIVFFTEKEYADITVMSAVKGTLAEMRKIRRQGHIDLTIPDSIHMTLSMDKDYAFAKDIPYWDGIKIGLYQNGNYGRIDVSDEVKGNLTTIYTESSEKESFLCFDNIASDSCLYLKETDSINWSAIHDPDPDELSDFLEDMTYDILASLPGECYRVEYGLFGKSTIIISATGKELTESLSYAFRKNKESVVLKNFGMLTNFEKYLDGLSKYSSENDLYTLTLKTDRIGRVVNAAYSQMINGHYNSYEVLRKNNYISLIVKDNENFFEKEQNTSPSFNETRYTLRYGKDINGKYSVYGTYESNGEGFGIKGESVSLKNGKICGRFSAELIDGKEWILDISGETRTIQLHLDQDGKTLVGAELEYEYDTRDISDFKTCPPQNKYSTLYEYSDVYKKDKTYSELQQRLQLGMILDFYGKLVETEKNKEASPK